jgi:acetyltransferase
MAVDSLIELNGKLADLSEKSITALDNSLPPIWSGRNPVDVLGDANARRYEKTAGIVLDDAGVDALLVILTPQAMTRPNRIAVSIGKLAKQIRKPVLAAWMGGETVREAMEILVESGVATYNNPEQAVRAFMTLVNYADNLEDLYHTPKDIMVKFSKDQASMRSDFLSMIPPEKGRLSERDAKTLLNLYGISATCPEIASSVGEAASIADRIGYPVVLKIHSPDITHKTEVGGVALDIKCRAALREAWKNVMKSVSLHAPDAEISGISVQRMISSGEGVELILGARKDPVFGTVIMVGKGGVATEIWGDTALGFPPLNEHLADRMLRSLKVFPLLSGFRGRVAVNIDMLTDVMMRFSYLVSDNPEIDEIDINPLLCTPKEITALDARASITPGITLERPFEHLALRPYPSEYVTRRTLSDGTAILLRPIKPEDEPMWMEMLGNCSKESIYSRFGFFYNWSNHDAAVRFCYIDYDREIAIVAETSEEENRSIHAIGRLIADPDLESMEYAILVDDQWQNRGLGGIVTEYCEKIATKWGIKRIIAQTTVDNKRMIHLFETRGYQIDHKKIDGAVNVCKELV